MKSGNNKETAVEVHSSPFEQSSGKWWCICSCVLPDSLLCGGDRSVSVCVPAGGSAGCGWVSAARSRLVQVIYTCALKHRLKEGRPKIIQCHAVITRWTGQILMSNQRKWDKNRTCILLQNSQYRWCLPGLSVGSPLHAKETRLFGKTTFVQLLELNVTNSS